MLIADPSKRGMRSAVLSKGFDPSAAAYFAAAGITDPIEQSAYNAWVVTGKPAGWYSLMYAWYPFLGTTGSQQSFNSINAAANQITWNGTVAHSNRGMQGNGSDGYADSNLLLRNYSMGNFGMSIWRETVGTNVKHVMGAGDGTNTFGFTYITQTIFDSGQLSGRINPTNDNHGLLTGVRRSATDAELFINGGSVGTNTSDMGSFSIGSTDSVWISAQNSPSGDNFKTDMLICAAGMHQGFTSAQALSLWNATYTFMGSLGRDVQLIADGDSLTRGYPDEPTGYPPQLLALDNRLGMTITAVDGAPLELMNGHAVTDVDPLYYSDRRFTAVVMQGGINDICSAGGSILAADLIGFLDTYIAGRQAAGLLHLFIGTLFDCQSTDCPGNFGSVQAGFNAYIRSLDGTFSGNMLISVVDYAAQPELQDASNGTYFYTDKKHLTPTGYGVMTNVVKAKVYAVFPLLTR